MFSDTAKILAAVQAGFFQPRVVVIGDAMLDCYLWGEVSRISPEAPVPVVRLQRRSQSVGGAANVAHNLAALGCAVSLVAAVGDDAAAADLRAALATAGISDYLVRIAGRRTTVKTRILGGRQQMMRLDEEDSPHLGVAGEQQVIKAALDAVTHAQVVILSDYAKGVVNEPLCRTVIAAARERNVPVLVDPKGTSWQRYQGATTITPNAAEFAAFSGMNAVDLPATTAAARQYLDALELGFITLTRGEHGIALIERTSVELIPAQAQEVFDVSGAGDTVIATLAAGLAAGLTTLDAVRLANLAASVVVGKVGTVPITAAELKQVVTHHTASEPFGKIALQHDASTRIAAWRAAGQRVVFTNGCFDILHAGHVMLLEHCRQAGDRLVVGLNEDASIRRQKGPTRPVNPFSDRAAVLSALSCVDMVVGFAEDTPLEIILALHPDVLAKGADYEEANIVGAHEVKVWGGQVLRIELLAGRSTTSIIQRQG